MSYYECIVCIIVGMVLIKKPELLWGLSHLLGNKDEQANHVWLSVICLIGIAVFIYGLLPFARQLFKV